ncbi:MAG: VWA domain-containing protein [Pseudomonadales bacterium]|jgi:F0F1-type ATP synthase membrane subunit b/b'|nr:VWA domain-containing protein [Pseudomonadales bacterium]
MSGAAGAGRKRSVDPISMSFLDVISCGFGAVILLFMMMRHSPETLPPATHAAQAETNLLDQDIQSGKNNLVKARNTLAEVDQQLATAQGLARQIQEQIDATRAEIAQAVGATLSEENSVNKLKADVDSLQAELERLRAAKDAIGNNARPFVGDGNRQYLTGMILGGKRILLLVDNSGSMLDATIVNIIRRRNMAAQDQLQAPKWQRVLRTVDWLTTQLPPSSQYQLYTFNNATRAVLSGTDNRWLDVADEQQLQSAVDQLKKTLPAEGTNLELVFEAVRKMNPLPDNIFLLTDGLPTLGSRASNQGTISGRDRELLFERAVQKLPTGIPVNVILAPLEGDPAAASWYWQLAINTGGSFMMPSDDWP